MKRVRAVLVAAAITLSGCGKGSTSATSSTTRAPVATSATTAITVTSTTQNVVGDKQAATAAVILASDLGPPFTGSPHDRTTDTDMATCVNNDPVLSGTDYPTQADGEDFTNNSGTPSTDVQSSVRVAPTVAAASASMVAFKSTGVLTCLKDLITSSLTSGQTISSIAVTPLTVPPVGDDVVAFKIVVTGMDTGTAIHSTEYAYLIRKGRALCQLSVNGINLTPSISLANRLATTMATRASTIH